MILGVIFSITGIGLLIALMFNMAIYALPLFAAVSAGRLAFASGAGWLGAIIVGALIGILTLGLGQFILAAAKSSSVRLVIALAFALPAGFAGYHVVLGLSHIGGAHGVWQTLFGAIGALIIAGAALARLTTPLISSSEEARGPRAVA